MFVRDVYSEAEEEMMRAWRERAVRFVGWVGEEVTSDFPYPVNHRVATKELILHHACAADYKNPLWRDEKYARNTRWGGIIAPPFFLHSVSAGPFYYLEVPQEVGVYVGEYIGEFWEFFKPIYINDSFKVWCGMPELIDITRSGAQEERRLKTYTNFHYYNQKDEHVGSFHRTGITLILPPGTEVGNVFRPGAEYMPETQKFKMKFTEDYVYTDAELEAIDRMYDAEEIRGAEIRWWEDVEIGERLKPVVMGPLTTWDMVVEIQGHGVANLPMMEARRLLRDSVMVVPDPATNILRKGIEIHLSDKVAKAAGFYSTTIDQLTIEHFLSRLVTNWAGDDGFLRSFEWIKLLNTPIGDTIFGNGKVVNKYVNEKGEHLVAIDTWIETNRGYISNTATVTINLLSREKLLG